MAGCPADITSKEIARLRSPAPVVVIARDRNGTTIETGTLAIAVFGWNLGDRTGPGRRGARVVEARTPGGYWHVPPTHEQTPVVAEANVLFVYVVVSPPLCGRPRKIASPM